MSNPSDLGDVGKWPCPTCTYHNPPHLRKCELCLTPRPKHTQSMITNPMHQQPPQDFGRQRSAPNQNFKNHSNAFHAGFHASLPPIDADVDHEYDMDDMNGAYPHSAPPSAPASPSSSQRMHMHSLAVNNYGYDTARVTHVNKANLGKRSFHAVLPEHITFNPNKAVSEQSIFERWMIAQIERQTGQQPTICVANNVILSNLSRARAATTIQAIQQRFNAINNNNNNHLHRSMHCKNDGNDDSHSSNNHHHDHHMNAPHAFDAGDFTDDEDNDEEDEFSMVAGSPRSHTQKEKVWSATPTIEIGSSSDAFLLRHDSKNGHAPGHNRVMSSDAHYHHKKQLNERRKRRTHRKDMTVAELWFKAQSQLKQGKNPSILRKYNIQLQNIRQHNPRFRDFQRRRSHLEKAASYLQVTGQALNNKGMQDMGVLIDDDQEDEDEEDEDESKSNPSTPYTPQSISQTQPSQQQQPQPQPQYPLQPRTPNSIMVPEHFID
mmetsp:Transcript_55284/g.91803  ORF Transcript_55284/g.91803 Transcript_55284/m.91803 type:complete len:491 (-) Transcript_55284:224-1696(-)